MDNIIINPNNEFLSEAVQKLAFKNGYEWFVSGKEVKEIPENEPLICVYKSEKALTTLNLAYAKHNHPDTPILNANTDWQKIEDFFTPKEPMRIWVNVYESGVMCLHPTKEEAQVHLGGNGVTKEFIEAI